MQDEYDFSKGERGKFYRKDAEFVPPVHLESEVLDFMTRRAKKKGVSVSRLVNQFLRKDIEIIESAD